MVHQTNKHEYIGLLKCPNRDTVQVYNDTSNWPNIRSIVYDYVRKMSNNPRGRNVWLWALRSRIKIKPSTRVSYFL